MADTVIRVESLGKLYRIGAARGGMEGPRGLRHALEDGVRRIARHLRGRPGPSSTSEDFWALKDVSFEVKRGECVAVIGRNGAGKSTLLKILSRITEPTTGEVGLKGRVGSLLEVGTGFHPELTGRENIFLNGAVLGMGRKEISHKFDEIVAFSEIEKFLDTPVKRYSSGMYVRLAFAVAAHLEPEVLIVDEVLAVGDAQFQQKCLGKMGEVTKGGRTVLFVSHNMAAVRAMCSTCCVLTAGRVAFAGPVAEGVAHYMRAGSPDGFSSIRNFRNASPIVPVMTFAELTAGGKPANRFDMGESLMLRVGFTSPTPIRYPRLGLVVADADGRPLFNANNRYQPTIEAANATSRGIITCDLARIPFMPGRYHVSLWFGVPAEDTHVELDALSFEVESCDVWGTGQAPPNVSPFWWPAKFSTGGDGEPEEEPKK
jgi:lipopolysaccharide transport system ATP-binding protein